MIKTQKYTFQVLASSIFLSISMTSLSDKSESKTHYTQLQTTKNSHQMIGDAKSWNLSEDQWKKYLTIKNETPLGFFYPMLSPPALLGVAAETEEERRRFAEIYSQVLFESTQGLMDFEFARLKATRLLYGDVPIINKDRLPHGFFKADKEKGALLKQGDTIKFLINKAELLEERVEDKTLLVRLLAVLESRPDLSLDVYFPGIYEPDTIRSWAKKCRYSY